ncbi:MAG: dTMP kinase [Candidatus Altimarinota bacterium]
MFIALYGINNIGKSTQVKRLKEQFEKIWKKVKIEKYPVYDLEPTGPRINYFLRDPEAPHISGESLQMLYIQNRVDFQPQLQKDLKLYDVVIAEDYIGTGMAWGMTQGVPYSWLQAKNMQYKQLKPDLEILMDGNRFLSGKEANHRNEADDEAVEKTRENFLFLAKKYGWPVVNANQSEEQVTQDLWRVIVESFEL